MPIKAYQKGSKIDTTGYYQRAVDLMNKYKNLNWVHRALHFDEGPEPIQNKDGSISTHLMAYGTDDKGNNIAFPLIVQKKGSDKLERLKDKDAWRYAIENKEYINLGKDNNFAEYFTSVGYKYKFPKKDFIEAKKDYDNRMGDKIKAHQWGNELNMNLYNQKKGLYDYSLINDINSPFKTPKPKPILLGNISPKFKIFTPFTPSLYTSNKAINRAVSKGIANSGMSSNNAELTMDLYNQKNGLWDYSSMYNNSSAIKKPINVSVTKLNNIGYGFTDVDDYKSLLPKNLNKSNSQTTGALSKGTEAEKLKEATEKKAKLNKGLGMASFGANMLSSVLDSTTKNTGKLTSENGISSSAEGIANMFGPWGMAASAAMKLGPSLSNAIGKNNKYGVATRNQGAAFATDLILNPVNYFSNIAKADYLTSSQKWGSLLNPYSAFKKAQEYGKDQETADQEANKKRNEAMAINTKLNDRRQAYNSYLGNMAASSMMVAKEGMQLTLDKIKAAQMGMVIEIKTVNVKPEGDKGPACADVHEEEDKESKIDKDIDDKSIIPDGVSHGEENNNCDINGCDTGLSIVAADGTKIMEIEQGELALKRDASMALDNLVEEYNKTKDKEILKDIGKLMREELLDDTYSYNPSYSCLNNNTCKIK